MIDRVVTITGPPGSGKSTAGRRIADPLRLEFISAGELFRAEAARRGLSLPEFSRYAEQHEEVDRTLDDQMVRLARPGRLLDGRLTGILCHRRGIPCISLEVTAREEIRHRRLAQRDHLPLAEAIALTTAREASERERFQRFYGIDVGVEPADLTIDSSDLAPDQVAERLLAFLRATDRWESA